MKQNVIFSIGNLNDFFIVQRFFEEKDILIFRMFNENKDSSTFTSCSLSKSQIESLIESLQSFLKEPEENPSWSKIMTDNNLTDLDLAHKMLKE